MPAPVRQKYLNAFPVIPLLVPRLLPFPFPAAMSSSISARMNVDLLESKYQQWKENPRSVEAAWSSFFEGFELGIAQPKARTPVNVLDENRGVQSVGMSQQEMMFRANVSRLLEAYRAIGHTAAWLDPLSPAGDAVPRLSPQAFGFTDADMQAEVETMFYNEGRRTKLGAMIERLRKRNPKVRVEAFNPPFRDLSDEELDSICTRFAGERATIVWVGLSTPKQERLTVRLSQRLPKTPIVAIGAGFDFVAGLKPVAPGFVTALSLEWLFRLASEPRRLFKRYAEIIPKFLLLVGREAASGRLLTGSKV